MLRYHNTISALAFPILMPFRPGFSFYYIADEERVTTEDVHERVRLSREITQSPASPLDNTAHNY